MYFGAIESQNFANHVNKLACSQHTPINVMLRCGGGGGSRDPPGPLLVTSLDSVKRKKTHRQKQRLSIHSSLLQILIIYLLNSNFNSLLAFMLEFVVLRAAVRALVLSLADLPCFTYFIAMIIVLLGANK